jgi:hypothetical protein
MPILPKKQFEDWVKKQEWLKISETDTTRGRQHTYLTPAGQFLFALYDIKGELMELGQPVMMPRQSMQQTIDPRQFFKR